MNNQISKLTKLFCAVVIGGLLTTTACSKKKKDKKDTTEKKEEKKEITIDDVKAEAIKNITIEIKPIANTSASIVVKKETKKFKVNDQEVEIEVLGFEALAAAAISFFGTVGTHCYNSKKCR